MSGRTWPAPRRWLVMYQSWQQLLFAHWPVPAHLLQQVLPPGVELDTFDGTAWVGVVPFWMRNVRFRGLPPIPTTAAFPELNVRTYAVAQGKPGVWFLSLDAGSRLAVVGGRHGFHLPYHDADMRAEMDGDTTVYSSRRRSDPQVAFAGRYRPAGSVRRSTPGTLEHWLTERYCLYASDGRGGVFRAEIDHEPWPLQDAQAQIETNTMTAPFGILLEGRPLLHYARRIDVRAWTLDRVDSPEGPR